MDVINSSARSLLQSMTQGQRDIHRGDFLVEMARRPGILHLAFRTHAMTLHERRRTESAPYLSDLTFGLARRSLLIRA
jgi:hypothetical protein